jgi:hypothetical protein
MPEPALSPAQLLAQHAEALAELRAILKHQQQVLDALLLLAAQHEDRLATMQRDSRWREIRACNDNACGELKSQNSHDSLLDLPFLIAATDPKASIY